MVVRDQPRSPRSHPTQGGKPGRSAASRHPYKRQLQLVVLQRWASLIEVHAGGVLLALHGRFDNIRPEVLLFYRPDGQG